MALIKDKRGEPRKRFTIVIDRYESRIEGADKEFYATMTSDDISPIFVSANSIEECLSELSSSIKVTDLYKKNIQK